MKHKSLFDKTFKYVPSSRTNIRKTFKRIRKELLEREKQNAPINLDNLEWNPERKKA